VQTLRILASLGPGKPGASGSATGFTGDPRLIHLPTIRPPVLPMRIDDIIEARRKAPASREDEP
jgi:hypothetical protein